MNANELADAMEIRASIRRKATSRKSVTEGANDRLADQLDQAATILRQQQAEIEALKQIIDANNLNQNIGQFVKPTNELADEVMEHYRAMLPRGFNVNWMQEAATMLRQQQAEIEELKEQLKPTRHYSFGYEYPLGGKLK